MINYREVSLWKDVKPKEWNDWHWQLANRITDIDTLSQVIALTPEEKKALNDDLLELRMAITPYYATLMDPNDINCP
ncbi:MAG TPA: lysine 2,3-aminomutase, partial [Acetomicrobium hydrogeniformans]|nr:lysine 2,3-aminomutase [Acetomicrobium hydrogeniformans]